MDTLTSRSSHSPGEDPGAVRPLLRENSADARTLLAWSSFVFAVLQNVCTVFVAVSGLRLLIGISSLAISAGVGAALDRFHGNWIRVPMMSFAFVGSLLNLAALIQIRRLRRRPAARWRQKPLSRDALRMERLQLYLSLATFLLIGVEEYLHIRQFHSL